MIKVSENLFLKRITNNDTDTLFKLMKQVYTAAYHHFWEDSGDWYINTQYAKENVIKELSQQNAEYYFIVYNDAIVGNLRIIWDEKLIGLSEKKQIKLHRIYLHQKTQGKGLGKKLLYWLQEKAKQKGYKVIWLDAMNEKMQAFEFYKKQGFIYFSHYSLPYNLMFKEVRKLSQLYKEL